MVTARWCLLALIALGASSCSPSARTEAASLVGAVDRFRDASDAAKVERARAIAAVPCSDASVCKARRACEDAVVPSARAVEIKNLVAARLADIRAGRLTPDSPEASSLPSALGEAERLLAEGREKMPECERSLAELRAVLGV
ncbi:MAG: hypothetical protein ABTD50_14625 [Polyangiaceae bacterium]